MQVCVCVCVCLYFFFFLLIFLFPIPNKVLIIITASSILVCLEWVRMLANIGSGSRLRVFKESPGLRAGPRASVPYMGGCQN